MNSPVLSEAHSVRYLIHRVEDVTDFIRLKESSTELQADIVPRGQRLQQSNEQLRGANAEVSRLLDKTRELDALKTQFFANVSHELRTPLTLVVDDDAATTSALSTLLGEEGHRIETAASAEEALELIDAHHPEVAVVDVTLPGMSGVELVRQAHERAPALKCLLLTGHDAASLALDGADVEGVISKPISIEALVQTLARLG